MNLERLVIASSGWLGIVIWLVVIAGVSLAAILAIRLAAAAAAQHVLDRREPDADQFTAAEFDRRVRTLQHLVVRIVSVAIVIVAVLTAMSTAGIEIGAAIAGLGVVGIAVGLGAQTLIRDWLAGIFIVVENQYSQGDVVRIAGVEGVVEGFSLRRTLLRDLDGTSHNVPNGQIVVASNLTRLWARQSITVKLARGADEATAREVVGEVGRQMRADSTWQERLLEPPGVLRAHPIEGGTAIEIGVQALATERSAVIAELQQRLLAAFAARGVELVG